MGSRLELLGVFKPSSHHQMVGQISKDYLTQSACVKMVWGNYVVCVVGCYRSVDQRTTNVMVLAFHSESQPLDNPTNVCTYKSIVERRLHCMIDFLQCVSAISCKRPLMHPL